MINNSIPLRMNDQQLNSLTCMLTAQIETRPLVTAQVDTRPLTHQPTTKHVFPYLHSNAFCFLDYSRPWHSLHRHEIGSSLLAASGSTHTRNPPKTSKGLMDAFLRA